MAVNTPEDNVGQTGGQAQASENHQHRQANQQAQTRSTGAGDRVISFRDLSSLGPRLGSRNLHSEYVAKFVKILDESIGALIDPDYEHKVIALGEEAKLGISVVVVTVLQRSNRGLGAAYYTMLLEQTAQPLAPRIEQIGTGNGQSMPVEILRTTGDRFNKNMRDVVEKELRRQLPNVNLISADGTRVPADLNLEDKAAVQEFVTNAYFAPGTVLSESDRSNFKDFNLANVAKDSQLSLRPIFGSTIEQNAVNEPVRSDITLTLSSSATSPSGIPGDEQTNQLYRTSAFIDFLYMPQEAPPQQAWGQPAPALPPQQYAPRIVITKAESYTAMTLAMTLLGLVQVSALLTPHAWMQCFLGRSNASKQGAIDLRDPGYLNIEANLEKNASGYGIYIDTKEASFGDAEMYAYLSSIVRSDILPIVSQDIPVFDPSTWNLSPLLAAAKGNQAAYDHIISAADTLTNGNFSRYFPKGAKFVSTSGEHVHLGYYIDPEGRRRDIRDIDLNAVLAVQGHNDPKLGAKWSDTFLATDVPEAIRLQDRKNIIDVVTRGTVVYTGIAERVNYSMAGLAALGQGCTDAGLDVKQQLTYTNIQGAQRHRAALDAGVIAQAGSYNAGFLNRGVVGQAGPSTQGYGTASRWN